MAREQRGPKIFTSDLPLQPQYVVRGLHPATRSRTHTCAGDASAQLQGTLTGHGAYEPEAGPRQKGTTVKTAQGCRAGATLAVIATLEAEVSTSSPNSLALTHQNVPQRWGAAHTGRWDAPSAPASFSSPWTPTGSVHCRTQRQRVQRHSDVANRAESTAVMAVVAPRHGREQQELARHRRRGTPATGCLPLAAQGTAGNHTQPHSPRKESPRRKELS